MKNLSKDKRQRLALVCIGTIAAIAGLYFSLVATQRNSLQSMAKKQTEQKAKLENAERLTDSTPLLQKNLAAATADLEAIESTMASGDMYSWIILTVNSFKENYKVEIPQFSREVPSEVGMYPKFPYRAAVFHLRGTAYFHDFGKFVADFENAFPYMRLQNIELEPPNSSNANPQSDPEKLAFKMEIVALVNPITN
jgi:hypothetical protein